MAGGKGSHGGSRFIRHLRMKRALGIPLSHRMWPTRQMRGRDRRRGTWFDRELNCIAIEAVDFAQDTEEGGADRFELIPDSDEDGVAKGSSLLGDDDEYVPETEPQDVTTASKITGPCANHGRLHLGTALREWRRAISDVENESAKESVKVQMDTVKLEKESVKVQMGSVKMEKESVEVLMGSVKLEKQGAKVEMDSVKLEESAKVEMDTGKKELLDHKASFSDIETDDETCWFQDGVDLRGHSQVEDDDFNDQGLLIVFVIRVGQPIFVK